MKEESLNISATDVVRLILQYLKENNLMKSFYVLQEESNVKLNAESNLDILLSDIKSGNWKQILHNVATLDLSEETLIELYALLISELIEKIELELAKKMMEECVIFKVMQKRYPAKFEKLNDQVESGQIRRDQLYDDMTKEEKRNELCERIKNEITVCAPSRLLALISMALKWQNHHNLIKCKNGDFDIFKNTLQEEQATVDLYPEKIIKMWKFGTTEEVTISCAIFSSGGSYLITGSSDGFIEIWEWTSARISEDFIFQKENQFMMHSEPISSLCISKDDHILLSGDVSGLIKIWEMKTGIRLKEINAHTKAITSIAFSKDNTQILTASCDNIVKIFGLKSLKCLKEMNKHSKLVYSAIFTMDYTKIICASSKGKIYIYNYKNSEIIHEFQVMCKFKKDIVFPKIRNVELVPKSAEDIILVCCDLPYCYIMDLKGKVLKTFSLSNEESEQEQSQETVSFVYACISPNCKYVYCLGDDHNLYCFNYITGKRETQMKVEKNCNSAIMHSPTQNIMACWSYSGTLSIIQ